VGVAHTLVAHELLLPVDVVFAVLESVVDEVMEELDGTGAT
jgi:hypothetical protein